MGYDAYVKCDCYKTGKVKSQPPFPYEENVYGNGRILTPECENDSNSEKCREQWQAIIQWRKDTCEHSSRYFIFTRVANTWGMSDFKWALEHIGASYFPILNAQLPVLNGGLVEAVFAYSMLKELELFQSFNHIDIGTYLLDTTTGKVIYDYIPRGGGIFAWYREAGINLGLDADGFFVRKYLEKVPAGDEKVEFFRSKRFEQRLLSQKSETAINDAAGYFEKAEGEKIELINLEANQRLVVDEGLSLVLNRHASGVIKSGYPRFLHVEKRPFGSERYVDIVDSLKQLCEASIATGNPIIWC